MSLLISRRTDSVSLFFLSVAEHVREVPFISLELLHDGFQVSMNDIRPPPETRQASLSTRRLLTHQSGRIAIAVGRVDADRDLGHFIGTEQILAPDRKSMCACSRLQWLGNQFRHADGGDVLTNFTEPPSGYLFDEGAENLLMVAHPRSDLFVESAVKVDVGPADRSFAGVSGDRAKA